MVGIVCGLAMIAPLTGQDQESRVWVIDALARLKKAGLLVGIYIPHGARMPTRYEAAVAVHATCEYVKEATLDLSARLSSRKFRPGGVDPFTEGVLLDLSEIRSWVPALKDLEKLASTYSAELKSLDVPQVQHDSEGFAKEVRRWAKLIAKLPTRVERFSDIPRGHWADEAIHALRRAGVLEGYPAGKFRG
jgi:hypothetical protein